MIKNKIRYSNVNIDFCKREQYGSISSVGVRLTDCYGKIILRHTVETRTDKNNLNYKSIIDEKCLWCLIHVSQFVNWEKARIKRWSYFKQWLKLKM